MQAFSRNLYNYIPHWGKFDKTMLVSEDVFSYHVCEQCLEVLHGLTTLVLLSLLVPLTQRRR